MIKSILNFPITIVQSIISLISSFITAFKKKLQKNTFASFLNTASIIKITVISLITFAIAFIIQPFGINEFQGDNKSILISALTLSGTLGLALGYFGLPSLLSSFYNKNNWTVGKSIFGNIVTSFFFGLFIMVFATQTGIAKFELPMVLLKFTGFAAVISFIYNFIKETVLHGQFTRKAEEITSRIHSTPLFENKGKLFPIIKFTGSNDVISLVPNQLIKVTSEKYTSEIVYQNLFGVASKNLEIPVASIIEEISNFEQFMRLNESTYVNKNAILKATGNASGIHLAIHKDEEPIQISQKYLKNIF